MLKMDTQNATFCVSIEHTLGLNMVISAEQKWAPWEKPSHCAGRLQSARQISMFRVDGLD